MHQQEQLKENEKHAFYLKLLNKRPNPSEMIKWIGNNIRTVNTLEMSLYLCVPCNPNSLIFSASGITGSVTIYIVTFEVEPSIISASVL